MPPRRFGMIHLLLALRRTTTPIFISVSAPLASAIKLDPVSGPRDAVALARTVPATRRAGAQTARAAAVARARRQARHVGANIGVVVAVVRVGLLVNTGVRELVFELLHVVVDDV